MQHTTGSIQTSDGLKLHTEAWLPEDAPKASILLVHGLAEHIGRYGHVAAYFVQQGYAVYGLDHRTHGKSGGEPRVYITDFNRVVDDLKQYFDILKTAAPDQKFFLYGHSMGSFISLMFCLRYQAELDGLISSGCPVDIEKTVSPMLITIGNLLNNIAPKLPLVKLDLNAISRDRAVVDAYNSDPLVYNQPVRVRMGVGYQQAVNQMRERLAQLRLPILLLHGGGDKIAPPSGSEKVYRQTASPDRTLKIYPGLYHEIHNEPEKAHVLADILDWLNQHV